MTIEPVQEGGKHDLLPAPAGPAARPRGRTMSIRRAVAAPCFADDPADLVRLAVEAEQAGFDGSFLWDHITWADDGLGPPIVDPWAVLSVIAARTQRLVIGPMITPVPRRRPWVLARQTVTLDLLAGGRTVFGVGLGAPAHGDFGLFGDPADDRRHGAVPPRGAPHTCPRGQHASHPHRDLPTSRTRSRTEPMSSAVGRTRA
jgi:hypothetical protein